MHPGADPVGAPPSFTARRPNASNLPNFELPPPQLSTLHQKYQPYPNLNTTHPSPVPTSLTSVGNLLTPPSNSSGDGLSPVSSGVTSGSSASNIPPYTPNSYTWPAPPPPGGTPYGFQSGSTPQPYIPPRGLFSPSLNSIVRGTNSPSATDSLPPPPYDLPPFASASMPMSAPASLPAVHTQHAAMMNGHTPVSASGTQSSPVSVQDGFARPPPTPTYFHGSQPSSTPQHSAFPYSAGPSPIQQSPLSAGGQMRMSPNSIHGSVPPLHAHQSQPHYQHQRPYTYPLPGPVLSNINNPNGGLAIVGGIPPGMMPGFNSGHAASMHMYAHHPQQQQQQQQQQPIAQSDRPFKCDQCPQSFNRNHDLKRHKRIHLAVKPFPCGHCDKSFSRKDALKRHILVKGCGKAGGGGGAPADGEKGEGSLSPVSKSDVETSPVVAASV
ncbi:hypothetical protein LTR50_002084 [Elasticomyces elasticus]|nr:hypothetical protein LTR50_002084 [Elasticomyces elasticus]